MSIATTTRNGFYGVISRSSAVRGIGDAGFRKAHALPDPAEHLITVMRGMVQSHGGRFLIGLPKRDARYEAFFQAQGISFATSECVEACPAHGNRRTPKDNALVAERVMALLGDNGILPAAKELRRPGDDVATNSVQLRN
jgi:hypothetical protein